MKKLTILVGTLALSAWLFPVSAQPPQGITNLTFDGFCDGMTLNVSGLLIGGTHNLYDCANTTEIGGNISADFLLLPKPVPGLRANVGSEAGPLLAGCLLNYYFDFSSNTWANYITCAGEPEALINHGTFTIGGGTSPTHRGSRSSASGTAQAVVDVGTPPPGIPQGTFDISFNGFCDGMHLTSQVARIGGTLTGCAAGIAGGNNGQEQAGIIPNDGSTGPGGNVGSSAVPGCVLFYYVYWTDQTWANYITCGGEIPGIINAGTFTYAPPGGGGGNPGRSSAHR